MSAARPRCFVLLGDFVPCRTGTPLGYSQTWEIAALSILEKGGKGEHACFFEQF